MFVCNVFGVSVFLLCYLLQKESWESVVHGPYIFVKTFCSHSCCWLCPRQDQEWRNKEFGVVTRKTNHVEAAFLSNSVLSLMTQSLHLLYCDTTDKRPIIFFFQFYNKTVRIVNRMSYFDSTPLLLRCCWSIF